MRYIQAILSGCHGLIIGLCCKSNAKKHEHGNESADRSPLSIEDYLLIPYIIKHRDSVEISNQLTKKHKLKTILYRKTIGNQYVYVEEIRIGRNKSLAFVSLYKRPIKKASHK